MSLHKMVCHICGRGPRENISLFRQNETGVPGVWACAACSTVEPDDDTKALVEVLERGEAGVPRR